MQSHLPSEIAVTSGSGQACPFWSVMIPTYRPDATYLRQALESVLKQDPGPQKMQIEVVDDCSPGVDVAQLVGQIAGDRVAIFRNPTNQGLAGCWNSCIARTRGEWVHILHQDDMVLPGFYERLRSLTVAFPEAGMAYSRFALMDEHGHWQALGPLEQDCSGALDNWLERLISGYHLECPAIIVKRSVYKKLGAFNQELNFALDVEMWIRIAAHYRVAYEPAILACFRRHPGGETARLEHGGSNMMDVAKALKLTRAYLPPATADRLIAQGNEYWAGIALMLAVKAYAADNFDACAKQLNAARMLCNQGKSRKSRLRLAARNTLKRAMGTKLLGAMRRLRSTR
jgi:glycosyltransferase involved in cell wall biosynthesis